jgi:hypothetical protein
MRINDERVTIVAKEVGMLDGRAQSNSVTVGDLTMEFEYETPDENAYIEVYKEGKKRPINSFQGAELSVPIIKKAFPQFFEN